MELLREKTMLAGRLSTTSEQMILVLKRYGRSLLSTPSTPRGAYGFLKSSSLSLSSRFISVTSAST